MCEKDTGGPPPGWAEGRVGVREPQHPHPDPPPQGARGIFGPAGLEDSPRGLFNYFLYSTFEGLMNFLPSLVETTPVTIPSFLSPPQISSWYSSLAPWSSK